MITGTLPPVSNAADWPDSHAFELYDDDTNDAVDLSAATEIKLQIREQRCGSPSLSASLTGETITLSGTSTFFPTFTAAQMSTLYPGSYDIGVTAVVDGTTIQLVIGSLPVIDGIIR